MARFFSAADYPRVTELNGEEVFTVYQTIGGATTNTVLISDVLSKYLINILDISTMTDVSTVNPTNGQVLTFDSTSGNWMNGDIPVAASDLVGLTDTSIDGMGAGENGYVLTYNNASSNWVASPTATPTSTLATLTDVNVSAGAGINNYVLTWDNSTSRWIAGSNTEAEYTITGLPVDIPRGVSVVSPTSPGSGYIDGVYGTITTNGVGTGCTVEITTYGGVIQTVTRIDTGNNYAIGEILTVDSGNGDGTVQVDILTPGPVDTLYIFDPGSGYIDGEYATTTTNGVGTGCTVTITTYGGVIQTVTSVNAGAEYVNDEILTIAGGSGGTIGVDQLGLPLAVPIDFEVDFENGTRQFVVLPAGTGTVTYVNFPAGESAGVTLIADFTGVVSETLLTFASINGEPDYSAVTNTTGRFKVELDWTDGEMWVHPIASI